VLAADMHRLESRDNDLVHIIFLVPLVYHKGHYVILPASRFKRCRERFCSSHDVLFSADKTLFYRIYSRSGRTSVSPSGTPGRFVPSPVAP
jgi:hypothetical protein